MPYAAAIDVMGEITSDDALRNLMEALELDMVGLHNRESLFEAFQNFNGKDTLSFDIVSTGGMFEEVRAVCKRLGLPYRLQWTRDDDDVYFTDGVGWRPGLEGEAFYTLVDGSIGLSSVQLERALEGGIEGVQAVLEELKAKSLMDIPQVFTVAPDLIERFASEPAVPLAF